MCSSQWRCAPRSDPPACFSCSVLSLKAVGFLLRFCLQLRQPQPSGLSGMATEEAAQVPNERSLTCRGRPRARSALPCSVSCELVGTVPCRRPRRPRVRGAPHRAGVPLALCRRRRPPVGSASAAVLGPRPSRVAITPSAVMSNSVCTHFPLFAVFLQVNSQKWAAGWRVVCAVDRAASGRVSARPLVAPWAAGL